MILKIDEVNRLRSVPYDKYFGVMDITPSQKKKRKEFSERLEDVILDVLMLISTMRSYSKVDNELAVMQLKQGYIDAAVSVGAVSDDYLENLALLFALSFIETTFEHEGDEWYISNDRAKYNAENEANTVLNYSEYRYALDHFKYKTWHTEADERVRPTHIPLEGEKIPINELFVVGESLMRFPKDTEYAAPEEIVNCRCSITFSN